MNERQHPRPTEPDRSNWLDPRFAEGRSRIVLFVGMGGLGLGTPLGLPEVVLAGVALIAVAFAMNTVGKLVHYRALPVPRAHRVALGATWTLLAVCVVGLLATYAAARYGAGAGAGFWPLAVAAVGFGLLHMAAQSKYLPADAAEDA